jgi:hypothetical protein
MIVKNTVGAGRPEKYGAAHVVIFKEIVRQMGLRRGCYWLRERGIKINGKVRKLDITMGTLSKYISREDELTGEAVVLHRGRPSAKSFDNAEKQIKAIRAKKNKESKTQTVVTAPARRGRPKKSA